MKLYQNDEHLTPIFASCLKKPFDGFYIFEMYIFNKGKLAIPQGSIKKFLVKESHERGLIGHHEVHKNSIHFEK